jgi:hypothetical protein
VPFYAFPPNTIVITKGAHHVKTINKYGRTSRRFCGICSAMVVNDPHEAPMQTVSAMMMKSTEGIPFTPMMHIMYGEKSMSVKDGLPKIRAFPDMEGKGELVEE